MKDNYTTFDAGQVTDLLSYPDESLICFIDKNTKMGYNLNGKVVIEPIYDYVEPFCDGIALTRIADKYQYIYKNGEKFYDVDFVRPGKSQLSEGIILLKSRATSSDDEKAALADIEKIKTHFNEMSRLIDELNERGFDVFGDFWDFSRQIDTAIINASYDILKREQYRYINLKGEEICSQRFDEAEPFREGFACVCKNRKWGYINAEGEIAIPLIYDCASSFSESVASVELDGVWGAINCNGGEVVPFEYDYVSKFYGGIASVRLEDEWGVVDKNGKEIVSPKYYRISPCGLGVAVVGETEEVCGLMNASGEEITPLKYTDLDIDDEWVDGVAIAMIEEFDGESFVELYGFLGIDGKEVTPIKYSRVERFKESRALVERDDKVGFVDLSGEEVVEVAYDNALSFSCGLAMVMKDGMCGYIDLDGNVVIPLQYECANSFANNVALVRYEGKVLLINTKGEIVKSLNYDEVIFEFKEISAVKHNDKYGLINSDGELIVPIIYEAARGGDKCQKLPAIMVGGRWCHVDSLGNVYSNKFPHV